MNWVDWLLIAFLFISIVSGFVEGFIRMGIGFAALIAGFLFGVWFYGPAGAWSEPYVKSETLANVIGFNLVFIGIIVAGALLAWVIQKIFRVVGLSWLDRLVGGAFGVVRGVLVLAIGTLIFTAFYPGKLPGAVYQSELAPYVLGTSRVLAEATPYEIKSGFERGYKDLKDLLTGRKHVNRAPAR
jgi:membrane protein required for colicin V production